jgi:ammonium transporter, Amt family
MGGIVGLLANGLFAATYIVGLDGVNADAALYPGGFIEHHYSQLYKQLAYVCAAIAWSFVMSAILAFLINLVPGLKLRASDDAELLGMDDDQVGEFAYDYVEVRRDYLAWTPATADQSGDQSEVKPETMYGIPLHRDMASGDDSGANGEKPNGGNATELNGRTIEEMSQSSPRALSEAEKSERKA